MVILPRHEFHDMIFKKNNKYVETSLIIIQNMWAIKILESDVPIYHILNYIRLEYYIHQI